MTGLFGGPPKPPPVTRMPDENDPAVLAARRKQYEMASERAGRASTFLADAYQNDKLGGRS